MPHVVAPPRIAPPSDLGFFFELTKANTRTDWGIWNWLCCSRQLFTVAGSVQMRTQVDAIYGKKPWFLPRFSLAMGFFSATGKNRQPLSAETP